MVKISYLVKSNKQYSKIYIRLQKGKDIDIIRTFGEYSIPVKEWDTKKQRVYSYKNNYSKLNDKLIEFEHRAIEEFNLKLCNDEFINNKVKDWFTELLEAYFKDKRIGSDNAKFTYFLDYLNHFNKNIDSYNNFKGEIYSKAFKSLFTNIEIKIELFEKMHGRIKLVDVSINFRNQFVSFLKHEINFENSTINKYIKGVKLICKFCETEGFEILDHYKKAEFKRPSYETIEIYLNENEISSIDKLNLDHNKKLDKVKDCFIISLWTGLRFSDLKKLNVALIDEIKENEQFIGYTITITTQKTNQKVTIPLHSNVVNILYKYNWQFPILPSNKEYNQHIKEIARLANIDSITPGKIKKLNSNNEYRNVEGMYKKYELVKAHTSRRSFATNMYLKGFSTYEIMQITGHKNQEEFFKYIRVSQNESAIMILKKWNIE